MISCKIHPTPKGMGFLPQLLVKTFRGALHHGNFRFPVFQPLQLVFRDLPFIVDLFKKTVVRHANVLFHVNDLDGLFQDNGFDLDDFFVHGYRVK